MQYLWEFLGLMAVFSIFIVAPSADFAVKPIRDRFIASGKWFNRITGAALVGFGIRLALARAAV